MNEIWKPIEGTDGRYEVSNTGKIRSLNFRMTGETKVLSAQLDTKGYCRIRIKCKAFTGTLKVHREVAKAFIPNPDNKLQVNHINGIKTDNRVENLEWVSGQENVDHAMKNHLWANNLKASQKTNEKRKVAIKATNIKTGEEIHFSSMADAERALGTKHINAVISGTRKQAKGYSFAYVTGGDADATDY